MYIMFVLLPSLCLWLKIPNRIIFHWSIVAIIGIEDPVEGIIMVIMMIARIITDARYLLRVPVPLKIYYP